MQCLLRVEACVGKIQLGELECDPPRFDEQSIPKPTKTCRLGEPLNRLSVAEKIGFVNF